MPINVTGTHGKQFSIEVLGVAETFRMLKQKGFDITKGANIGCIQAGALLEEEIKESIAGHRTEPRSVDTGEFINSVSVKPIKDGQVAVYSDVIQAIFMEYGTSKGIEPRMHFRNSLARNKDNIIDILRANTAGKV